MVASLRMASVNELCVSLLSLGVTIVRSIASFSRSCFMLSACPVRPIGGLVLFLLSSDYNPRYIACEERLPIGVLFVRMYPPSMRSTAFSFSTNPATPINSACCRTPSTSCCPILTGLLTSSARFFTCIVLKNSLA